MSRRKGRRRRPSAPMSAAGLITYFEEEVGGIKIRPEALIAFAVALMLTVLVAHLGLPGP